MTEKTKKAKLKVRVSVGLAGCRVADEVEIDLEDYLLPDGNIDADMADETARDMMFDLIDWGWEIEK